MLVTYRRLGGPKPRSDELLTIDDGGDARLRRVVNVGRVGTFHAALRSDDVAALRKLIDAAAKATVTLQAPGRPPFETEEIEAGAGVLRFHPVQKLPKAVAILRDRLVETGEDLLTSPVSAIELGIAPGAGGVRLAAVGDGSAEVDWAEGAATYDLFGPDEGLLSSGEVALDLAAGQERVGPGWTREAALPPIGFAPSMTLQVRLGFRLKYADDVWREAQVRAVAGKGWE